MIKIPNHKKLNHSAMFLIVIFINTCIFALYDFLYALYIISSIMVLFTLLHFIHRYLGSFSYSSCSVGILKIIEFFKISRFLEAYTRYLPAFHVILYVHSYICMSVHMHMHCYDVLCRCTWSYLVYQYSVCYWLHCCGKWH